MSEITINTTTGQWVGGQPTLTHEEALTVACAVLPGLPRDVLDGCYTAWLEQDSTELPGFEGTREALDALTVKVGGAPTTEHRITKSDEIVRGHPGTVVRCVCGWADSWASRDGSAEASAAHHMAKKNGAGQ